MFSLVGKILLTVAMAAIGQEVTLRQLTSVGGRAITAGSASTRPGNHEFGVHPPAAVDVASWNKPPNELLPSPRIANPAFPV